MDYLSPLLLLSLIQGSLVPHSFGRWGKNEELELKLALDTFWFGSELKLLAKRKFEMILGKVSHTLRHFRQLFIRDKLKETCPNIFLVT